jgi:hypothetical protein
MKRRAFLTGSATSVAALTAQPGLAHYAPPLNDPPAPGEMAATVARLRAQFKKDFEPSYVENVIIPHFLVSVFEGERSFLPMIDLALTKENPCPMIYGGF